MSNSKQHLVIREIGSGRLLADAKPGQYHQIEGNWYVEPSAVDQHFLRITDQEYRCPAKGRCLYVDFEDGARRVPRVAWVYDDIESGWEHIKGRYGFYASAVAEKFGKTKDSLI